MDANGSTPTRTARKPTPTERFLGAYPHARPGPEAEDPELSEDDIFFVGSSSPVHHHNHRQTPPPSAPSTPRDHHKGFSPSPEPSGILAALPDPPRPSSHHFYQKPHVSAAASTATSTSSASSVASSASSSSARLIPKPPQERVPALQAASSFSRLHPQSAPVNVPVMMGRGPGRRKGSDFDDVDEEEMNGGGEEAAGMLPPHEMVARARGPPVACSVLEGVGRTLKGRDLRQVRNAVWRRTGFLD